MITLDQVLLLEQKVESAVKKIQQLQSENDALRKRCSELTNAVSAKSEQLLSFENDQNKIESGIRKALDRLNFLENSVINSVTNNIVMESKNADTQKVESVSPIPTQAQNIKKNESSNLSFDDMTSVAAAVTQNITNKSEALFSETTTISETTQESEPDLPSQISIPSSYEESEKTIESEDLLQSKDFNQYNQTFESEDSASDAVIEQDFEPQIQQHFENYPESEQYSESHSNTSESVSVTEETSVNPVTLDYSDESQLEKPVSFFQNFNNVNDENQDEQDFESEDSQDDLGFDIF